MVATIYSYMANHAIRKRQSGIELLRIISMWMIVAHHLVEKNAFNMFEQPTGARKAFFEIVFFAGGKIGVVVFFTITAWFFLDREQTFRASLRRIWLMERELLFWSILLCVIFFVFARPEMTIGSVAKSVFPLLFGLWWYPTSYALFLILLPFLQKGLRALTADDHKVLSLSIIVLWGVVGLVPKTHVNDNVTGVFAFCFLYVIIAYYKWRCGDGWSRRAAWLMIATGYVLIACYWVVFSLIWSKTGRFENLITMGADDWKLGPVLVAFGLFILFERLHFYSRCVNYLAGSAFAVYLISMYPQVVDLLWHGIFDMSRYYTLPLSPLIAVGIVFVIYAVCTVMDVIRRVLFAVTIDRNHGKLFDSIYMRYKGA